MCAFLCRWIGLGLELWLISGPGIKLFHVLESQGSRWPTTAANARQLASNCQRTWVWSGPQENIRSCFLKWDILMPKSLRCILEVYQCIEPLRITQPKFIAESNSILAILQHSFANSRSTNAVFLRNVNIDIDQNHYMSCHQWNKTY